MIAAAVGIFLSFLGNRFYVFDASTRPLGRQLPRFLVLYGSVLIAHGIFLTLWSEIAGLDYRFGFLVATGFQVAASYLGNRDFVFN